MYGKAIAILGVALCMILCGTGSAMGLFKTGSAASGVLAEDGNKFTKVFLLALLPATQGIYGFVLAVMKIGEATLAATNAEGLALFGTLLTLGVTGFSSAWLQGKTAASGIMAIGKNDTISVVKLLMFPAMVEFYAILALVLGIMI